MSSTLFNAVPPNYVLTSGANSALTWTNAISVSSMNISSLGANALTVSTLTTSSAITTSSISVNSVGANALTVSTLTTSSLLTASTISATRLNYSSLVGSTVSTNTLTLSAVNTSTQNTQIYQTATTNPVTSYSVIQASHVSTGITNNNLALNPSGGNVGVGTTAPATTLHITNSTADPAIGPDFLVSNGHGQILLRNTKAGSSPYSMSIGVDQTTGAGYMNAAGNAIFQPVCLQTRGGNVGIGTTIPGGPLHVYGPGASYSTIYTSSQMVVQNSSSVPSRKLVIGVDGVAASLQSVFNDTATAYLALNPNGNFVGIGTNSPTATLDVLGTCRIRGAPNASGFSQALTISPFNGGGPHSSYTSVQAIHEGSTVNELALNRSGGNIQMGGTVLISPLNTNGTVITINSTGQLSVSSDRRIKENIVYQSDTQQGLASVLNLKPATYRLIGSSDSHLGFIAQDLEQDIPLAVDGKKYEWQWETTEDNKPKFDANGDIVYKLDADGNKIVRPRGVSDRAIIATLTLAIQELAKRATSQDALVQELSKQLTVKSAALDALIAWAQTQGYVA